MSAAAFLSVLRSIEQLYEGVVDEPAGWNEQGFADWAGDAMQNAGGLPREAHREIRRSLRAAQKLQTFWLNQQSAVSAHDDWRTKVDIALGPPAWRPLLDLARIGLETTPSEELFDQVKQRFALVNSDRWMDGITFEEWSEDN